MCRRDSSKRARSQSRWLALAALALMLLGCGSSKHAVSATAAATTTAAPSTTTTGGTASGAGALQGEAAATASGDIPDNQTFLTFRNPKAGYSVSYPEGWAQNGSGSKVTIRDKNNIIRILVSSGKLPVGAAARRGLRGVTEAPSRVTIARAPAVKLVYASKSAPNPVTGTTVTLVVDRYYLTRGGKLAVVDLGTPRGVDNVDAYRMIVQSFRWR